MSGLINKIKDAVHSDNSSAPEGSHGPHTNRAANAADPRVDSDRDHRAAPGGLTGTHGTTGVTGTHGTTGLTGAHGATTTAGPHSSNIANQADPRVDSDLDGRGLGHGTHGTTGIAGTHGTSGLTGTHGTHGATTTAGPHSSNLANKADPRVDSDLDGRGLGHGTHGTTGVAGTHGTTTGLTGTHGTHGTHGTAGYGTGSATQTAGPHSSNIANKADPRVDSDRDGRGLGHGTTGTHSGTHAGVGGVGGTHAGAHTGTHTGTHGVGGVAGSGPGPAPNTAGPHKSDMLNKIDPRVDSNLDGSKTVGGNKTYQAGTTTGLHKDPTDAAQVPPSVLQKTVGPPVVEHGDHGHDRVRRNSQATHQETFRGV